MKESLKKILRVGLASLLLGTGFAWTLYPQANAQATPTRAAAVVPAATQLPYLVISMHDPAEFSAAVSAKLRAGYVLRGPMVTEKTTTGPQGTFYYLQNLVLPDKHQAAGHKQ